MSINITNKLKNKRRPRVINKTFDDFRNELLTYANNNFSDKIKDFSEASLGGMFIDFAASVGESMSFYLEQQFDELNYETATNINNIERHLRQAGIKTNIASPAIASVTFFIEAIALNNTMIPTPESLPVILKDTVLVSNDGISFILQEDIDFSFDTKIVLGDTDEDGEILTLIIEKEGLCSSGSISNETVNFISDETNSFITYSLSNNNVTNIISVIDNDLNVYYEVDHLSQDTVYLKSEISKESFYKTKYASHRFVREDDLSENITSLRFGNGKDVSLKDDILSNPEDFILPINSRGYDYNYSLDPKNLLVSNTLGVSPQGKSLSIKYQHGGGLNHNVKEETIQSIEKINIVFPNIKVNSEENEEIINLVTESISVTNKKPAVGGTNRLNMEELVNFIPMYKKMQNRVINHEDLIARIYTMPSNFGRVSKVSILDNPYSSLSKNLYIVCKDSDGKYINASDNLKINLKNYINNFRMIGDSYNIIDSPIFNFGIDLVIKIKSGFESETVLNKLLFQILQNMRFDDLQIGEAINVNDIIFIALSLEEVVSVINDKKDIVYSIDSSSNFYDEELDEFIEYSQNRVSIYDNFKNGLVFPPIGGIFELKYEDFNISIRNG